MQSAALASWSSSAARSTSHDAKMERWSLGDTKPDASHASRYSSAGRGIPESRCSVGVESWSHSGWRKGAGVSAEALNCGARVRPFNPQRRRCGWRVMAIDWDSGLRGQQLPKQPATDKCAGIPTDGT
jgi:hypothetical protein